MAGIGSYKKGKAFALKSGNKPSFKNIGSSPLKTAGHTAPAADGHQHLTNEQKLAAANRRKEEGISKRMSKYNIDKKKATEIWTKQNPPAPQPKSPAKTHKPGHTGPAPKTISRKEELLNQGFTQEDADQMIKSGAVTGKVGGKATGKAAAPAYIKTIQNKKAKGGKLTKAEKRQLDEYRIHVTEQ